MPHEQVTDNAEKYFSEILEPQFNEFFNNPATLRCAFNLATALFHFHEWLYEFHRAKCPSGDFASRMNRLAS